jgi:hypothetical protein
MVKYGLLLVPEKQQLGGIRLLQRRICFTALSPIELFAHAKDFGAFAIEFEPRALLALGALPAFYLPQKEGGRFDLGDAGSRLLKGFDWIEKVLGRLKDSKDSLAVEINEGLKREGTDLHNLYWVPAAAKNLFYPAGNEQRSPQNPLGYYKQREWKIIENFPRSGSTGAEWDFKRLEPEERRELTAANPWLESDLEPGVRRIDECLIFEKMGSRFVIDFASRFIVPREAKAAVEKIVAGRLPVAVLEDVVGFSCAGGTDI